jgi:hypothetical protein
MAALSCQLTALSGGKNGVRSLPLALPPWDICSIIRKSRKRRALMLSERQASLSITLRGSLMEARSTPSSVATGIQDIVEVGPLHDRNMHLDRQIRHKPSSGRNCCTFATAVPDDPMRSVVGKISGAGVGAVSEAGAGAVAGIGSGSRGWCGR